MNVTRTLMDAFEHSQFISIFISSNQVELIFDNGSGYNPFLKMLGNYELYTDFTKRENYSVPNGILPLVEKLNGEVDQINLDERRLLIEISGLYIDIRRGSTHPEGYLYPGPEQEVLI